MERVTELLVVERNNSEMFQSNFNQLKAEYGKLVFENSKLSDEITRVKEAKSQPLVELKQQLAKLEQEVSVKNDIISSFQEKCHSLENVVREKSWQETMYSSKISSTEKALEQTYSLLNNLQIEVSSMTNDVESAQLKDEAYYRGLFLDLSNKCNQLEKEKKFITHEVLKVTGKASKSMQLLKQENVKLTVSMEKLKDTLDKINSEKSQVSTDMELLKVQQEQQRGEYLMQIRSLECELTKMEGKTGILERSYQDTFQEMEKSNLSFLTTQNENVSLKTRLYELELKYEKAEDQHKKELDHAKYLHQIEKANLEKRLSAVENDLCNERSNAEHFCDKLRNQEKELIVCQDQLRRKEIEFSSRLHDLKMGEHEKYKLVTEEKLQTEIESAKKISELESQIILERNLKTNAETQLAKMSRELESMKDHQTGAKRLEMEAELRESEKNRIANEFEHYKQLNEEKCASLVKDLEQVQLQRQISEKSLLEEKNQLQEQLRGLQTRLDVMEIETKSNMQDVRTKLEMAQKKSQKYAALIWKLRKRLSESQS